MLKVNDIVLYIFTSNLEAELLITKTCRWDKKEGQVIVKQWSRYPVNEKVSLLETRVLNPNTNISHNMILMLFLLVNRFYNLQQHACYSLKLNQDTCLLAIAKTVAFKLSVRMQFSCQDRYIYIYRYIDIDIQIQISTQKWLNE